MYKNLIDFTSLTEIAGKETQEKIDYIAKTCVDFSKVMTADIFKEKFITDNQVLMTVPEINKIISEELETIPALPGLDITTLKKLQTLQKNIAIRQINIDISRLNSKINDDNYYIKDYEASIRNRRINISRTLREIKNYKTNIAIDIPEIKIPTFWQFLEIKELSPDSYNVVFTSTKDVILTQDSTPRCNVNLGRFTLKIHNSGAPSIHACENNIDIRDYIHPFVGNDASICFGNYQSVVDAACRALDYTKLLDFTANLLNSYDISYQSPWMLLEYFQAKANIMGIGNPDEYPTEKLCVACEHFISDCVCSIPEEEPNETCGNCGVTLPESEQCPDCWCPDCGENTGGACGCDFWE